MWVAPSPPYSFGQAGAIQPRAASFLLKSCAKSQSSSVSSDGGPASQGAGSAGESRELRFGGLLLRGEAKIHVLNPAFGAVSGFGAGRCVLGIRMDPKLGAGIPLSDGRYTETDDSH